jgi:hypothetical protein
LATSSTRSFLDDKESFDAIIQTLPPPLLEEYRGYGALSLEAVFPNRVMVVYTLEGGSPKDVEILKFGDISVTRIGGPRVEIADQKGTLEVGLVPTRWRGRDVFLHVPQNFTFKWKGKRTPEKGVTFVPHYAILIKSRSREHLQVDGHTYCVTLNQFSERFPGVNARY